MMPSVDMMQQYAPNVSPHTIAAIIRVESGGNRFAIGINGPVKIRIRPQSVKEAASEARHFISKGYSVDLGLMQINNRNLHGLGLTIEQAFDPRANIRAGATILARGYRGAIKRFGPGQDALKAALSAYNTGNYERGFKNGYVAKYYRSGGTSGVTATAISASVSHYKLAALSANSIPSRAATLDPYTAEMTIYKRTESTKTITSEESSSLKLPETSLKIAESQL